MISMKSCEWNHDVNEELFGMLPITRKSGNGLLGYTDEVLGSVL